MISMHRIILDCDPGVDDAIAILLALASPEIDLVGITTVVGNKPLELTTRNALRILALAGRPRVPVHAGCARLVMGPYGRRWPMVHGTDGLGDVLEIEPARAAAPGHAVDFIIETVMANPGQITLCPVGPMTNIALAMIKEPGLAQAVRQIVFMGGVAFGPGNSSPNGEFNVLVDPEAAQIVLSSGAPLTMFGLDVTRKARILPQHVAALRGCANPVAQAIAAMLEAYAGGDPCLHDPCVIAHLVDPTLFAGVPAHVSVLCEPQAARGAMVAAVNPRHLDGRTPNCTVITELDQERLFTLVLERLAAV